jgi:ABC-type uncharacterized transport system substrate-binding protein
MNYLKMLKEIDELTSSDFLFDMENKELPDSKPYTQEEASQMSDLLGRIYLIAHSIHCEACGKKYKL